MEEKTRLKRKGYQELQITNARRSTDFLLLSPGTKLPGDSMEFDKYQKLDFSKYYDIRTQDGQVFEGSRVYCHTSESRGMGGMSESSSFSIGFFQAGSLEATLNSGFLMKVNEKVTRQMQARKKEKERKEKLQRLSEQRKELNKQIRELGSR
jgi:hypothetical protein